MKELELTLRVRNNRLKERRDALGMTQAELADAAGVSLSAYQELEGLRRSAQVSGDGCCRWRDIALQLARFHCVEPAELFPPSVLTINTPVATRRINGDDLFPLLSQHQERLLEGPDVAHDRDELREQVRLALASLRPREAEVLRQRFGLDGGEERTLEQVGAALEVGPERIRQIEAGALRRLRHPKRSRPSACAPKRRSMGSHVEPSAATPIAVIIDTREQEPYAFDPAVMTAVRQALPVGDYSLPGYEASVAVERKSLEDFVASVIKARARFGRELRTLAEYDLGCVVVEGSLEDVLARRYRSGAHPSAVLGATLSIIVDHGVPVFFCGDRQLACRFVEGLLSRYHRKVNG